MEDNIEIKNAVQQLKYCKPYTKEYNNAIMVLGRHIQQPNTLCNEVIELTDLSTMLTIPSLATYTHNYLHLRYHEMPIDYARYTINLDTKYIPVLPILFPALSTQIREAYISCDKKYIKRLSNFIGFTIEDLVAIHSQCPEMLDFLLDECNGYKQHIATALVMEAGESIGRFLIEIGKY